MLTVTVWKGEAVKVETLCQASNAVRDRIETGPEWIGSQDWMRHVGKHAKVRDERGAVVALISYNGRVWALDGTEIAPRAQAVRS